MIRLPPRSTPSNSSAASDVYKRQLQVAIEENPFITDEQLAEKFGVSVQTDPKFFCKLLILSLIHI
ncbi:hypothetical protein LKL54_15460, partial [Listeria monocytogenes ATCC 19115]|nr:hypothetical protein [Listeria monocytogenes ATCC 19115]